MGTYSIEIRAYQIITCTQVQTVIALQPTLVNIDEEGNGRIKLKAKNVEGAMELVRQYLEKVTK